VTVRGQSFIDYGLSTRFVIPQRRDDSDKGFKDKVYHSVDQVLYQHGHVSEKGDNVLDLLIHNKTNLWEKRLEKVFRRKREEKRERVIERER
jgi:hypothetical protein